MPQAAGPQPRIELPTETERRWHRLRLAVGRINERLERALSPYGLSLSEYTALAALQFSDDGGHLRQQVLADAVPLNQSSLSRLVARLEREGLTERYHCYNDRRGVYTQITEKGRRKVHEARTAYLDTLREALADEEADDLLTALFAVGAE
ncbi:MarR family winged helix-turn-helix transcriptional regulator [Goodfellowiella coeruleoviolacea]|uniref:DNA-binding transcriptional regulator, MarR family n=1 Tax=Goodfellowiella coeruleoviolacea TaxID=334858 RepID=A0AAE3KNX1_9PSEU|nr:MarR family transcriptional regulator [Goodfellowiella coeruleoviolacea]MCP2169163.1 DNA-binding transcriptional regulator, MarR family [Goodfellowiella coeruleoviolacea]